MQPGSWAGVPGLARIVVLDLLGYGRSDRPLGRAVGIEGHAARVVGLLDELRIDRACIAGHGMGGGVALWLAQHRPERVSHLCLIDSVAPGLRQSIHAGLSRAAMPLMGLLPPAALAALVRHDLLRGYEDPVRAARSVELYLRPFTGADGRSALLAHLRAGRPRADDGARLRDIRIPTALVWGEDDRAMPLSVGIQIRDAIPGAQLSVIPGVKHFTPEEAPREVADALAGLLS